MSKPNLLSPNLPLTLPDNLLNNPLPHTIPLISQTIALPPLSSLNKMQHLNPPKNIHTPHNPPHNILLLLLEHLKLPTSKPNLQPHAPQTTEPVPKLLESSHVFFVHG